ncbi:MULTISPECIES: hypothetical protein [unclassified Streptomyces]|uniref:hypothetical protein n=1 Tax=unclassified Streptomyces TaxID=2593676 RepID=UPI002E784F5B|nr:MULTISPECIES: hypothetical protein [unclassified Streptomyces]MEE1761759.1 hypothetical protein [Streptomyces sp. SP18BB07]MEE1835257.1 hypothetical protein [Streptomyces sp. SP17KL33]
MLVMSMAATAGVPDEDGGETGTRAGAAPSAVSMAVLGVEGGLSCAGLLLVGIDSGRASAPSFGVLLLSPLLLLLILFAAALMTVAYVLPAVALAHWTARQVTGRVAWWWIPPACTLWVLPALAVPSWLLPGLAFYAAALPPALITHHTLVRADMGRPVQPCAAIILWGTLATLCLLLGGAAMAAV